MMVTPITRVAKCDEVKKTQILDDTMMIDIDKLNGQELIALIDAGFLHEEYVAKNYDIVNRFSDEEKQEFLKTIKTAKLACKVVNEHNSMNYASLVQNDEVMAMFGIDLTAEILKYAKKEEVSNEGRRILGILVENTNNAFILYLVAKDITEGSFEIEIASDVLIDVAKNPYADKDSLEVMVTWLNMLQKPLTEANKELGEIIAGNKNVTDDMLIRLLDLNINISASKIRDKKIKTALTIKCLASSKTDVRESLAHNKTLCEDILRILTHDKDSNVSNVAKETLRHILNDQKNS